MALGSRALAEKQAIVSRLASIEALAGMDMLCSGKTGTLTLNITTIESKLPWGQISEQQWLLFAFLATKWTQYAKDAIGTILFKCKKRSPSGFGPSHKCRLHAFRAGQTTVWMPMAWDHRLSDVPDHDGQAELQDSVCRWHGTIDFPICLPTTVRRVAGHATEWRPMHGTIELPDHTA